jgi:hypothetical protein
MSLIVTVDTDWAPEKAIEDTLDFLLELKIKPTVFITHDSEVVKERMKEIDVGLHPFFSADSSHGATVPEVVDYVMNLPHNLPAFRCHRFAICNTSKYAMIEAGMKISSNVCTDLEVIPFFKDRFGCLEVPIFLEDGGYLWRNHSLEVSKQLKHALLQPEIKVILIHPMHFALNTPNFAYMYEIKKSLSRYEWQNINATSLNNMRWQGLGIRNFIMQLFEDAPKTKPLRSLMTYT